MLTSEDRGFVRRHTRAGGAFVLVLCVCSLFIGLSALPALATSAIVLTRFAGMSEIEGPPKPGPALESTLGYPEAVAVDSRGNVYIADSENNVVEKVTPAGVLSVIAGTGTAGVPAAGAFSASGVPATSSPLNSPDGVAIDANGNVYISDYSNHVVDKVTPGGTLTVVAGTGAEGPPAEHAFPPYAGVPARTSTLSDPEGLSVDAAGNLYICDVYNQVVEKVTPDGTLTVIAGKGEFGSPSPKAFEASGVEATKSDMRFPEGVVADSSGSVYISDLQNDVVDKVTGGTLKVIAGTGTQGPPATLAYNVSGVSATTSGLYHPEGLALDASGNLYIGDAKNQVVERVTPDGTLTVIAGIGPTRRERPTYNVAPLASGLDYPVAVAVDSEGVLYIDDEANSTIDRAGPEAASPPSVTSTTLGSGSATIDFLPPVSDGTSALTGYEASTDGGVTWHTITTTAGPGENLQATLGGLTVGVTYGVFVRAVNGAGPGRPSTITWVTLPAPASPSGGGATTPSPTGQRTVTTTPQTPTACRSKRAVTVHWLMPRGVRASGKITVTVNGRTYKTLPASARAVSVSFAGMSGPAAVTVRVHTAHGKGLTLRTERALHLCDTTRIRPRTQTNLHLLPAAPR